jgi:hypothetical protein
MVKGRKEALGSETVKKTLLSMLLFFFGIFSFGFAQEIEPEEPEIVLPSIILEIEDLSTEQVTAALPEEEELAIPEPQFPLPAAGEIEVGEPEIDFLMPQMGTPAFKIKEGKYLTAEAVLGAGSVNEFYSRISLYFLGDKPEGKLLYEHETLDGFSSKPAGSGYNFREDRLESTLSFDLGRVTLSPEGTYAEQERGLQGQGSYFSKINRVLDVTLGTLLPLSDWFSLRGSLQTSSARQLLTAETLTAVEAKEYYVSSSLVGEFSFRTFSFGIEPGFSYRSVPDSSDLTFSRGYVRSFLGIDISERYRLDGSLGWFWSEPTGHLVPFDLRLNAFLTDFFCLRLGAGYKVEQYNLKDVFTDFPLADLPDSLVDNHGWFFESGLNWIPLQGLILNSSVVFMDNQNLPDVGKTPDGTTGLFPFFQKKMNTLRLDLGARWNLSESFTTRTGVQTEILSRSQFQPKLKIYADANLMQKRGKYGAGASLNFLSGVNDSDQAPVVNMNGFFKLNDYIRFVTEIDDILYPLLDEPRYYWYPYVDPGFTLKAKVYINF